jgi:hypothetical protein
MSVLDQEVFIPNGKEQHWYLDLPRGKFRLQGVGDRRFYCGLFDQTTYSNATARGGFRFPFMFGSDRTAFDRTYELPQHGRYYVVVRVGTFNPPGGNVHVVLDRVWW